MNTKTILAMLACAIALPNCTYVEPVSDGSSSSTTTTTTTDHVTGAEVTTEETTRTYR